MAQVQNGVMEDLGALREDLESIKGDIARLSKNLVKEGEKKLTEVKKTTKNAASEGLKAVQDSVESIRESGAEAFREVQKRIEDRPIVAVAAAAGLGFILGKFVCRGN